MNKSGKHILTNRFKCLVYLLANNKWSGHFTLSVYKKVFIRQSSMGLMFLYVLQADVLAVFILEYFSVMSV